MGKLSSIIRNLINIIGLFILSHIGYRLYLITLEIQESNFLIKSMYEIIKALAKKYRLNV